MALKSFAIRSGCEADSQWAASARRLWTRRLESSLCLTRVPLDEYRTLSERDQVVVTGVVSEDNRGVFGVAIRHIPDWEIWEGQVP